MPSDRTTALHHELPQASPVRQLYTPLGVRHRFDVAVRENGGDIDAVFRDKKRYKQLIEMRHASFLALAIRKSIGERFGLLSGDAPDIHLLRLTVTGAVLEPQQGFPLEVVESFEYRQTGPQVVGGDIIAAVHAKKGGAQYGKGTHLLIASRRFGQINVSAALHEIRTRGWSFECIWLSIHRASEMDWTFFSFRPGDASRGDAHERIEFRLRDDAAYWF